MKSNSFVESDNFLALRIEGCIVVNVYIPADYYNDQLKRLFSLICDRLPSCLDKFTFLKILCIIVGEFNCNLSVDDSSPRVFLLHSLFDDWVYILAKDCNFTYIHVSSSISHLYYIVASKDVETTSVSYLSEYQVSDHLPISLSLLVPLYTCDSPGSIRNGYKRSFRRVGLKLTVYFLSRVEVKFCAKSDSLFSFCRNMWNQNKRDVVRLLLDIY